MKGLMEVVSFEVLAESCMWTVCNMEVPHSECGCKSVAVVIVSLVGDTYSTYCVIALYHFKRLWLNYFNNYLVSSYVKYCRFCGQ